MNNKIILTMGISIAVAVLGAAFFAFSSYVPVETLDNQEDIDKVNSAIKDATYYTVSDATTPATAIDPRTEFVYIAYFKVESSGANFYLQKSDDGGVTFGTPVRINEKDGNVVMDAQWSAPGLDVGPDGTIHAVWYHADYSEPDKFPWGQVTLRYSRSLDGGDTFEAERNPSPNDPKGEQSYPYLVVSKDNSVYISYLNLDYTIAKDDSGTPTVVRVVSSMDGGETFEKSVVSDPAACQCCATVATVGPDGELYASSRSVYLNTVQQLTDDSKTDYHGTSNDKITIRDITVSHSTDNGMAKIFSEPSRVGNDDWYMNGCPDSGPGMEFDSQGRLHIAWFTGSETTSNGQGFYYTQSDDMGKTFGKPVPIHLLTEKWIPPTTQYLAVDSHDNSWITFVNSEGLKKSPNYAEDYSYVGDGSIHLAIIDRDGNVLRNGAFATGDITKHYPYTISVDDKVAISWMEGSDVKLAIINTG